MHNKRAKSTAPNNRMNGIAGDRYTTESGEKMIEINGADGFAYWSYDQPSLYKGEQVTFIPQSSPSTGNEATDVQPASAGRKKSA